MANDAPEIEVTGPRPCPPSLRIVEYGVGVWCPTPDGTGPAEAVVFHFKIESMPDVDLALRMKTAAAVNVLIEMLATARDEAWPPTQEKHHGN